MKCDNCKRKVKAAIFVKGRALCARCEEKTRPGKVKLQGYFDKALFPGRYQTR